MSEKNETEPADQAEPVPATDTVEPVEQPETDTVETVEQPFTMAFDDAVALVKDDAKAINRSEWELGRVADCVEPKYGERTMEKFSEAIDLDLDRVLRARSTVRAYKGTEIEGTTPRFAIAQALQAHRDRVRILKENPDLTVRQARAMMREFHDKQTAAAIAYYTAQNERVAQEAAANGHDTDTAQQAGTNITTATPDPTTSESTQPAAQETQQAAQERPTTRNAPHPDWTVEQTQRWFAQSKGDVLAIRKLYGARAQEKLNTANLRAALAAMVEPERVIEALEETGKDLLALAAKGKAVLPAAPDTAAPDSTPEVAEAA